MQPLLANSPLEAQLYLRVTACPACHRGPWRVQPPAAPAPGGALRLPAVCEHCGRQQEFLFECPPGGVGDHGALAQTGDAVNPTPRPSRIVDLGQWLSLYSLLTGPADAGTVRGRQQAFVAARCLDEALKFYADDSELPPPAAFFTASSRQAYAACPEQFARQRLRDLRSRLPNLRAVSRAAFGEARGRKWWRLWRR